MNNPIVLYISHKKIDNDSIYDLAKRNTNILKLSEKYNFIHVEVSSSIELKEYIKAMKIKPVCIIYYWQGSTMKWMNHKICSNDVIPQIGLINEPNQGLVDNITNDHFDYHLAIDPTLILRNPIVYKIGRTLIDNDLMPVQNKIPVIGSFGFATGNKRFELLTQTVCDEFEKAIIKLNIPYAEFGDKNGDNAKRVVHNCIDITNNYSGITIKYSHDFLSENELLNFLNLNSINVFMYEDKDGRGISSVFDYALSVKVPIAISSGSCMFRHVYNTQPSIIISNTNSIGDIMSRGIQPLKKYYTEWGAENTLWEYERIVTDCINKYKVKNVIYRLLKHQLSFLKLLKDGSRYKFIGKHSYKPKPQNWSSCIIDYKDLYIQNNVDKKYDLSVIPINNIKYNRILDDSARELYKYSTQFIDKVAHNHNKRKNGKAIVQQAFVLDTILRLCETKKHPRILCVGSFEDTTFNVLKSMGYDITGIDPVLNYDLDTYITKSNINKFDVVFSTSVIEHVKNDIKFINNISSLVNINGYIIMTCDFKEGYKHGDKKPKVCYRFYTKESILNLTEKISNKFSTVDIVEWDCDKPDFFSGGIDYTFATIVLKRQNMK